MLVFIPLVSYLAYTGLYPVDNAGQSKQSGTPAGEPQSRPEHIDTSPGPQPQAEPVRAADLLPLNIRLLGTVVAGNASSVLVLLPGNSTQQQFRPGDEILPGVRLRHVDANAMVVERAGRLQSVYLESNQHSIGNPDTATDIATLMTRARLALHHDGEQADGLQISGIVVDSLYHRLGLYNGDILRKVNGTSLLRADQVDDLYTMLSQSARIELEILRAGRVRILEYVTQ